MQEILAVCTIIPGGNVVSTQVPAVTLCLVTSGEQLQIAVVDVCQRLSSGMFCHVRHTMNRKIAGR